MIRVIISFLNILEVKLQEFFLRTNDFEICGSAASEKMRDVKM